MFKSRLAARRARVIWRAHLASEMAVLRPGLRYYGAAISGDDSPPSLPAPS